jgi:hypothetical protein
MYGVSGQLMSIHPRDEQEWHYILRLEEAI